MEEYKYIIIPIVIIILSQFCKVIIEWIKTKRLNIERFIQGMGGMPSSHCAIVASITTIICLNYGFSSTLFAICFVFSLIIITDAMGIRYESEKQAKLLNMVTKSKLKENLGHEPVEALMGILFGIIGTILLNIIIK